MQSLALTYIFNQSLLTGIFPDEWKSAGVTPLYKNSGKQNGPINYRPISDIPFVAKIFEWVVYDKLYHYLTEKSILSRYQSGFSSLHSMVTALLEATDRWAMKIDRGFVNAAVFLDLKKRAFHSVDHNIILAKLHFCGIRGFCHKWLASYLSNRTQTCLINSMFSPKLVKVVSPGNNSRTFFFLLYSNDVSNCLYFSQPRMYADDTSLTFASAELKHSDDCLNYYLNRMYTWLSANKLSLN